MTPQAFYQVLIEHGITLTDKQKNNLKLILDFLLNGMRKLT